MKNEGVGILNFVLTIINMACVTLNIHFNNYGLAAFNFCAFLLCLLMANNEN